MEEGRWRYMEENRLIELFHTAGIIHFVARITVDYLQSATVGDAIRIETGLIKGGRSSFTMGQDMYLDATGKKIIEAGVTNVFVDGNSHKVAVPNRRFIDGWSDLALIQEEEESDG